MMKEMFQKSCLKPLMAAALLLSLAGGATAHEPAVDSCDCIQQVLYKLPVGGYYLDLIHYQGCTNTLTALWYDPYNLQDLPMVCYNDPGGACECFNFRFKAADHPSATPEGGVKAKNGICPGEKELPIDPQVGLAPLIQRLEGNHTEVVPSRTTFHFVELPGGSKLSFVKVCCLPKNTLQAYEIGFEVNDDPDLEFSRLPRCEVFGNPAKGQAFKVKYWAREENKTREVFVICGCETELGELPQDQPVPAPTPTPVPVP